LELDAEKNAKRLSNIIPKSMSRELKSFKVKGISFRAGRRGYGNRYH
jgi:hypothetical protein